MESTWKNRDNLYENGVFSAYSIRLYVLYI